MDENPTLSEAVFDAISDHFAREGNGDMVTGFLVVATGLHESGTGFTRIVMPAGQTTPLALGLVAFADESIRDDLRSEFLAQWTPEDDD